MSLAGLPSELLMNILSYLAENEILNLPLEIIARGLPDSSITSGFRTIEAALERQSLCRLYRASCHGGIAKRVTELRFSLGRLELLNRQEYLNSYWTTYVRPRRPPPPWLTYANYCELAQEASKDFSTLTAYYERYRSKYDDQSIMERQRNDVDLVRRAIQNFPNLKTTSIDNARKLHTNRMLGDAWCYDVDPHPTRTGSHLMEVLLKSMASCTPKCALFVVNADARPIWHQTGVYSVCMSTLLTNTSTQAIASAVQNLRGLRLTSIFYETDEICFADQHRNLPYSWAHTFPEDAVTSNYGSSQAIGAILRSAHLLEDLTLQLLDNFHDNHVPLLKPHLPLNLLIGDNALIHLSRIILGHFKIRDFELVAFFMAIAKSIENIQIGDIVLECGTWTSLFSKIRGQLERLQRFKVDEYGLIDVFVESVAFAQAHGRAERVPIRHFDRVDFRGLPRWCRYGVDPHPLLIWHQIEEGVSP